MGVRDAYDRWAEQYDSNVNRTRDLEAASIREALAEFSFDSCIEIGCGTGKNTEWLVTRCSNIVAVDLSPGMLGFARSRSLPHVQFVCADITSDWDFAAQEFDLIVFSLVLEHIADLDAVFRKSALALKQGGSVYIGELHPFKQYTGSKARFETAQGTEEVECHVHHISEFLATAEKHGLHISGLSEKFDEGDPSIPRILTLLLKKC